MHQVSNLLTLWIWLTFCLKENIFQGCGDIPQVQLEKLLWGRNRESLTARTVCFTGGMVRSTWHGDYSSPSVFFPSTLVGQVSVHPRRPPGLVRLVGGQLVVGGVRVDNPSWPAVDRGGRAGGGCHHHHRYHQYQHLHQGRNQYCWQVGIGRGGSRGGRRRDLGRFSSSLWREDRRQWRPGATLASLSISILSLSFSKDRTSSFVFIFALKHP